MAPAAGERLSAKTTMLGDKQPAGLPERARAFAFLGLPEKDRFGIFDPALRGFFLLGVAFGAVFGAGLILDAWGKSSGSVALAGAAAAAVVFLGFLGYRMIWPAPAERDLLLRMAREDDEARRQREARARKEAGRR